ncbi:MAG: amidohydrolase [Oscillospiraceae bacterium]|nr:amidohydrolase [Oscillospiraceae bacterium]
MIIDIHNHADYHGYDAEKMVKNMDDCGIGITCLMAWEAPAHEYDPATKYAISPFSDYPVPFERCLAYKQHAPGRFLLGFAPDPRKPDSIGRLKSAVALFDLSICGELKLRMMYDNPDAVRMYRYCGEVGLPVLMHFDYELKSGSFYPWPNYWYGGGIEALERALELCPDTNFIGHAPGFWAHISNDELYKTEAYPKAPVILGGRLEALLESHSNLYCDISAGSGHNALSRDLDYSRGFLERWQDRVLFGRDYYDGIHRELLESLSLPLAVMEKIYSENARRILRNGGKIPENIS